MELIKNTGATKDKVGRSVSNGDFKCGICEKIVNKPLSQGKRQLSCGCRWSSYKHGMSKTKIYKVWKKMKERCYNENETGYKHWGGRGIIVCEEWKENPMEFIEWANSNGYSDKLQIDRIDNDGNYEPKNCRFITQTENIRNRSWNKLSLEKAKEIKELYFNSKYSQRKLSRLFNTTQSNIWRVVNNKTWV